MQRYDWWLAENLISRRSKTTTPVIRSEARLKYSQTYVRRWPLPDIEAASTKQLQLQKMWKRRSVIPEPHLFAGLIKRTSFTFDEYFRPTLVPSSSFSSLSLPRYPSYPISPSPSYRSTLSNSPPIVDLYPPQSWYSLEALSFNFAENSYLLYFLVPILGPRTSILRTRYSQNQLATFLCPNVIVWVSFPVWDKIKLNCFLLPAYKLTFLRKFYSVALQKMLWMGK